MSILWLASGSPRRRTLLAWAGVAVEVHPADVDETWHPGDDPAAHARALAIRKAATAPPHRLALGADTVVHQEGQVLGKPRDRRDAARTLARLAGAWHRVSTGVCVARGADQRVFVATTEVRFRDLADSEIDAYVATGEADDKAGAYGIQGRAGAFVAEVHGCWTNVVGLPLEPTLEALAALEAP